MPPTAPGAPSSAGPQAAGAVGVAIAAAALLGWTLGIDPLTSLIPGWATVKPNTAIALGALGVALLVPQRAARAGGAVLAGGLAATALVEWFLGGDLGLNEVLFADPASVAAGEPPGRMAAATALGIGAIAASILLARVSAAASQAFGATALAIAWIALLGYAYELGPLSSVWLYGSVSFPTATALSTLAIGALLLRPGDGPVARLTGQNEGARLLRRLGPATLLFPAVTGLLALRLEQSHALQPGFGLAVGATLDAVAFGALLGATAAVARREEDARTAAEAVVADRERRLADLSQQLMEIQEAERRALARELHDELGQTLTGLGLLVERAPHSPEAAAEAGAALRELTDRVRRLSLDLRPTVLDDLGLGPALQFLAERFGAQAGLRVEVAVADPERRYPSALETAAYRIVQEALTNIVRHAGARSVEVVVEPVAAGLELVVEDDGRGFAPDRVVTHASVGLEGMKERARAVGGSLEIASTPGRTTVRAILPGPTGHP